MAETTLFEDLERFFNKCVNAQFNPNFSQQTKDKILQMLNKTLDFVIEETSPQKINQLVYAELKKKKLEKLNE